MGHTPGPWKEEWIRPDPARGHTFDPTCSILAPYTDDLTGAACWVRVADIPDPLSAEQEANARLIAAAPEHDAALRQIIDLCDKRERPASELLLMVERVARAAIARATGDSHA